MSPSDLPVEVALDRASGPRREEAVALQELFATLTGQQPVVWAGRIVGYGTYEYHYPSGHSGVAPELAFATGPREHTLYLTEDFAQRWPDLLSRLGKHRASKVCLYLPRLTDIDLDALTDLLKQSLAVTRSESPVGRDGDASR